MDGSEAATALSLSDSTPYPATITALLVQASRSHASTSSSPVPLVQRGTPLFRYSVQIASEDGTSQTTEVRTYESPAEGELLEWTVTAGQVITDSRHIILKILEPCLHIRQFHGMCTDCGANLTEVDYAGPTHVSQAKVRMSHDDEELLVSQAEAERLERDTADRLLRDRKLSLIVDLDQTVIHATVDPTVGDWMQKPSNPNYDALRGVSTFKLAKDGSAMKPDADDGEEGCAYYVKMRPGLKGFLEAMSELYEMHVYTMGTRSYAECVCRIIDPANKYFGGRILSRSETENEGLTSKSLNRLFPCDTSMVVIIDDRADVWEWSPNLVKVVPFDFFVGIGDINGAFLPKRSVIDTAAPGQAPEQAAAVNGTTTTPEATSAPATAAPAANGIDSKAQEAEQTHVIEEQMSQRPLEKAQKVLHAVALDKQKAEANGAEHADGAKEESKMDVKVDIPVTVEEPVAGEEAVLKDDDTELDRLRALLRRIHLDFYDAQGRARDVKLIIPGMKRNVLDGVGLLFSGVIPLSTPPHQAEIWRLAGQFGAICYDKLSSRVTHLVAAKSDTAKVNTARRRRDVTIVWAAWLFDSIAQWQRQDEAKYLIEPERQAQAPAKGKEREPPDGPRTPPSDESDFDADANQSQDIPVDLNWANADAELDAMLNETDSEAEGPPTGSKRSRTRTVSQDADGSASETGSPLSKRQKLASSRSSRLKLSYDASGEPNEASPPTSPVMKTATTTDDSDDEDYEALAAAMGAPP